MSNLVPSSKTMKLIYPDSYDARPHVETEYDDSALTNRAAESAKNIFLLGSATEGDPNETYEIKSSAQARAIFGSGDLVNAMELIWNPDGDFFQNGGTVYAKRVENASQATLTKGPLTFTSNIFGKNANKIGISLTKNAVTNAYDLRVEYAPKTYANNYMNIGNIFQLSYGGLHPEYEVTGYRVDGSSTMANKFTLVGGGDNLNSATDLISFDLTNDSYSNIEKLLTEINKIPGFQASPLKSCAYIKSTTLDLTDGNVQIGTRDKPTTVTDFYGDLVYATRYERYVTISINRLAAPTNVSAKSVTTTDNDTEIEITADPKFVDLQVFQDEYLQGGDDGYVPVSWQDKFSAIHGRNVYYIVPLTSEDNIHAELQEFLNQEHILGYNYMAFIGGGYNEDFNTILNRQMNLRSNRIGLVANSGSYKSLTGSKIQIPAYMMAAYVAGVASSLGVGEAVTNKYLNLTSLDQDFSGDQLNQLDENGIIAIENVINRNATGGYRIVEDVTTYNSTNEPTKSYISLQELTDFLFDDLRIYLEENFIGTPVRQVTGSLISTFVEAFLQKQVKNGLLASYDRNTITCVINGTSAYLSFSCAPARELRLIVVKGTYTNFTSTTSTSMGQTYSNGVSSDSTTVTGIEANSQAQTHYIDD